jgi:hypothetical protein
MLKEAVVAQMRAHAVNCPEGLRKTMKIFRNYNRCAVRYYTLGTK